ncbi:hypothetical protein HWV62_45055, partial [Athelia sp. TMB]
GVYFVTAFSGLLAPYWDSGAAGLLIGLSSYTTASHIARATLEAIAFQTRAIIESMELDSGVEMKHLKVDGGVTNGDVAMEILADVGGFDVIRPEMRESTALGSALLAGSAIGLFGWDITKPETLAEVNTMGSTEFHPTSDPSVSEKKWKGWQRAVERSKGWEEGVDEDEDATEPTKPVKSTSDYRIMDYNKYLELKGYVNVITYLEHTVLCLTCHA